MYNKFIINQYVQQESSKLKLKQTDTNSLAFKAIMNSTENEFGTYSNVIENFNYFKERFKETKVITLKTNYRSKQFILDSASGLAKDGKLHPMQEAFKKTHGLQCGYCTPGMVMSAVDLLQNKKNPSDQGCT